MQVYESGPKPYPDLTDTVMNGVPVTREHSIGGASGRRVVSLPVRKWKSGVYFVRLEHRTVAWALLPSWSRRGASASRWPSSFR